MRLFVLAFAIASLAVAPAHAGICVGTVEECATGEPTTGFDLLLTFEPKSAALTDVARENLAQVVLALLDPRLGASGIIVELRTRDPDMALAKARLDTVTKFLVDGGVAAGRIVSVLSPEPPPAGDTSIFISLQQPDQPSP